MDTSTVSFFFNSKFELKLLLGRRFARRAIFLAIAAALLLVPYLTVGPSTSDTASLVQSRFTFRFEPTHPEFARAPTPPENLPLDISAADAPGELPSHTYRVDGLLQVNPHGPHPIYELIDRAERFWDAKLQRASKTLNQAAIEYRHRYHRPPPKGFDHW